MFVYSYRSARRIGGDRSAVKCCMQVTGVSFVGVNNWIRVTFATGCPHTGSTIGQLEFASQHQSIFSHTSRTCIVLTWSWYTLVLIMTYNIIVHLCFIKFSRVRLDVSIVS